MTQAACGEVAVIDVYVFSSTNLTNIWAGIGAHRWAVAPRQGDNASIQTKAKNLPVGALGVLYCVEKHSFTPPFLVTSKPDMTALVADVWQPEGGAVDATFRYLSAGLAEAPAGQGQARGAPSVTEGGS